MKTYTSTRNRGKTIILTDVASAIAVGREHRWYKSDVYLDCVQVDPDDDKDGADRQAKLKNAKKTGKKLGARGAYDKCVEAITAGDPALKHEIEALRTTLYEMVMDLEPSLAHQPEGFVRREDGFDALPDLMAAGEELCSLDRNPDSRDATDREGDGAFRIIISTDVSWWGEPAMNAATMACLVTLLQERGAVELWIQQGWVSATQEVGEDEGVTLFKIPFTGGFDPTQLAFWCGHPWKDNIFSKMINMELGRDHYHTVARAELPCDLFLRGDWLRLHGYDEAGWSTLSIDDKQRWLARWIAATAGHIHDSNGRQDYDGGPGKDSHETR